MDTKIENSQKDDSECNLLVGTSGYSYGEWIEAGFYPKGTPSGRMLPLYAEKFSITELNYTWYQMPRPEAVERQRVMVPEFFLFSAKLTRTLTHEIDIKNWKKEADLYREGIAPLIETGQLAAVLIQFPPQFTWMPPNRKYLASLLDKLAGLPLAVEFRHNSWAVDSVFAELERRKASLVTVDAPDLPQMFPWTDVITNPYLAYFRFHGRNAKSWKSGNMQLQFDYNYSEDEMAGWIEERFEPMSKNIRKGILFFNNHVRAQAPDNAKKMIRLLKQRGFKA
jgi:uncharacterized protein YecE (DUF72 family)